MSHVKKLYTGNVVWRIRAVCVARTVRFASDGEGTQNQTEMHKPALQGLITSFNLQRLVSSHLQCATRMLLQLYGALPAMQRNLTVPWSQDTPARQPPPAGRGSTRWAKVCTAPCAPC